MASLHHYRSDEPYQYEAKSHNHENSLIHKVSELGQLASLVKGNHGHGHGHGHSHGHTQHYGQYQGQSYYTDPIPKPYNPGTPVSAYNVHHATIHGHGPGHSQSYRDEEYTSGYVLYDGSDKIVKRHGHKKKERSYHNKHRDGNWSSSDSGGESD